VVAQRDFGKNLAPDASNNQHEKSAGLETQRAMMP
jgi:hypothetical protein